MHKPQENGFIRIMTIKSLHNEKTGAESTYLRDI